MSNITTTHAVSGLVKARVLGREQISAHVVRVTISGEELARFTGLGFDQWFRLMLPLTEQTTFDQVPDRIDLKGFLRYYLISQAKRPAMRNYTVRAFRPESLELDIDVLVHGDVGVAGPWARGAAVGSPVAFIDQGCGFARPEATDWNLLVADETGMPALVGILADLPRDARGHAIIELADSSDIQQVAAPAGFTVDWAIRDAGVRPGALALERATQTEVAGAHPQAFAVGESQLATGVRRHLVKVLGIPKSQVTFAGYWKLGRSAQAPGE